MLCIADTHSSIISQTKDNNAGNASNALKVEVLLVVVGCDGVYALLIRKNVSIQTERASAKNVGVQTEGGLGEEKLLCALEGEKTKLLEENTLLKDRVDALQAEKQQLQTMQENLQRLCDGQLWLLIKLKYQHEWLWIYMSMFFVFSCAVKG